jgi:esterase/lipase superfamily enzyme
MFLEQPLETIFPQSFVLIEFLERVFQAAQNLRLVLIEESDPSRLEKVKQESLTLTKDEMLSMGNLTGEALIELVETYLTVDRSDHIWFFSHASPTGVPKRQESDDLLDKILGEARSAPASKSSAEELVKLRKAVVSSEIDYASVVKVFYATDRAESLEGGLQYDKERSPSGQLHYGECLISFPKIHKKGNFETPSILRLEFRPDPEKHIILQNIQSFEEGIFLERLAAQISGSATKEAFIFVHGYHVSFENAARRTGQLAFDLEFVGAPIFYSWPSNGKLADYLEDETNITWSTPHFQRFLNLLSQHSGAKRIHIIAHSMGNRAVCDALKALSYDPNSNLRFNHLVLAAPDIDADTFRELAATLQRLSGRITLYESSKDKAIQASKKIHGNPRAGEPLLIIPGLDTIDASAIDTDFLGHSYFSDNWPLLSDIHSLLFKDELPAQRFGLMEMQHVDGKYYAFRA